MKKFRRVAVLLIGSTVLAAGIALLVLPGPAFLVIPAGLGILALEFEWARRWLRKAQTLIKNATTRRDASKPSNQKPPK
ncbi:MAG TPA: PGPGW domain-containing protein [Candidatus Limnocylindria bacterium]|nr:PGPGW domain-containing protein [Candidatus Limnocylindria bacterium]